MATMKVHGNVGSTATARVLTCLYEKDLEFEFVHVDLRSGEHTKEPYLSLNPFAQVPAFEDGDLKLFESRAITQYLAHDYANKGTQLICPGRQMAILSVWLEVEAHQFHPPSSKLVSELAVKPMFGMVADTAVVEENEAKLGQVLDVYETRLSQSKYLAGDTYSLADLHHLPNFLYLKGSRSMQLFDSRPHVKAWVDAITSRPAWSKLLALKNQK
ncbi:GST_C domain-containing protein/GST_N domain-containing protein [Cephalotus follicularis]|uniref:glutathione transferase n=1 Tax=Cephalotus follicularis TaxID=3775 RepID=A0A1Q3DAD5_CEPFO|nr:GST_C domain-containing protein/GST_N domain-containing protein [Cephalotus follicularis]